MAAMSDYLENQVIDHLFRTGTFPKPAGVHLALFTTATNDADVGGVEVAGGSYARVSMAQGDAGNNATQGGNTGASTGASGQTANTADLVFPVPTANWGTIQGIGMYDAATGGNLLFHSVLVTPKTVNNGDPAPKFLAGALTTTLA